MARDTLLRIEFSHTDADDDDDDGEREGERASAVFAAWSSLGNSPRRKRRLNSTQREERVSEWMNGHCKRLKPSLERSPIWLGELQIISQGPCDTYCSASFLTFE